MANEVPQIVTRFDVRETEDGEEIRLFHKRTVLHRYGTDDIQLEDWEEPLTAFLAEKPRTVEQVETFLDTPEGEEPEEDEGEGEGGGSVVPEKYRVKYGAAQNCGDEIALALTAYVTEPRIKGDGKADIDGGLNREKLREVCAANGIVAKFDAWDDRGLNGGLLRMNASNVLRGMNRRGEAVVIGQEKWPARDVPKKVRAKKAKPAKA